MAQGFPNKLYIIFWLLLHLVSLYNQIILFRNHPHHQLDIIPQQHKLLKYLRLNWKHFGTFSILRENEKTFFRGPTMEYAIFGSVFDTALRGLNYFGAKNKIGGSTIL